MDFSFKNKAIPQKGSILLSDPFEDDAHFSRSVVLICAHDDDGTFGFVLNNFVHLPADELSEKLAVFKSRVSIGGPVDKSNMYYIHRLGNGIPNSQHIIGDLYFGGDFDVLTEQVAMDPSKSELVRFFIGYSGWDGGQLDCELDTNSWVVLNNCDPSLYFDASKNALWKDLMATQGRKYQFLSNFPINPNDN